MFKAQHWISKKLLLLSFPVIPINWHANYFYLSGSICYTEYSNFAWGVVPCFYRVCHLLYFSQAFETQAQRLCYHWLAAVLMSHTSTVSANKLATQGHVPLPFKDYKYVYMHTHAGMDTSSISRCLYQMSLLNSFSCWNHSIHFYPNIIKSTVIFIVCFLWNIIVFIESIKGQLNIG